MAALKRVWKNVTVQPGEDGMSGPALDGKPVRLPSKRPLQVKSPALAKALAEEWGAIPENKEVKPDDLPLTRITGNRIDRIAPDMEGARKILLPFGRDDTLCYRNEEQDRDLLNKALGWAAENGLHPAATEGIMPLEQPAPYIEALEKRLAAQDADALAAIGVMAPAMGSLLLPFALLDNALTVEEALRLADAEERRQLREGGHDDDLAARLNRRGQDVREAKQYFDLARAA